MEDQNLSLRKLEFTAPSGNVYTIREQNGEDDDIISNPFYVKQFRNITNFISAIVVHTTFTESGKLTPDQVEELPTLDRIAIVINSRMFSIGEVFEFSYTWEGLNPGDKPVELEYTQSLREYIFDDYSKLPTEDELEEKPKALPFYPDLSLGMVDIPLQLSSGKNLLLDRLNGKSEIASLKLPENKLGKNLEILARNLRLEVNGKFEKVQRFNLFSNKDMREIRSFIASIDPSFNPLIEISDDNGRIEYINFLSSPDFFFPQV